MSILMQSKVFRTPLANVFGKRPLGYMGFRRITDGTNFSKSESIKKVEELAKNLSSLELPPNDETDIFISFLPNRRYGSTSVYDNGSLCSNEENSNSLTETVKPLTNLEKWDAPIYD